MTDKVDEDKDEVVVDEVADHATFPDDDEVSAEEEKLAAMSQKLIDAEEDLSEDGEPEDAAAESATDETDETENAEEVVPAPSVDEGSEEQETPSNKAMAAMRVANREAKEKAEALELKLAELTGRVEEQGKVATPTTPEYTPDQVFDIMARAAGEQYTDYEGQNQRVMAEASGLVANMGSSDISGVLQKAQQGLYGEYSEAIVQQASIHLSQAVAREHQAAVSESTESAKQEKAKQELQVKFDEEKASATKLVSELPEGERESFLKFMAVNDAKLIGKWDPKTGQITEQGALPEDVARYYLAHPEVRVKQALALFDKSATGTSTENESGEVTKLRSKIAALNRELGREETVESPTRNGGAAPKGRTLEAMESELEDISAAAEV